MPDLASETPVAVFSALKARNLVPLLDDVCQRRGVMVHELCGRDRTLAVCRARQELWWLIRNHPDRHYSYLEIGRIFGRDHSTIRFGVEAHRRRATQ